jgi:hypothetical protein
MASTSVSRIPPASPERLWQLIGGFHALPDWLPFIPESTALEGGRVRCLRTSDGKVLVERLEQFNERQHYYTYSILEAPFAVSGHLATLPVYPVPGQKQAAEVVWTVRFIPEGISDAEAAALFDGFFRDGLDALQSKPKALAQLVHGKSGPRSPSPPSPGRAVVVLH